MLESLFNKVTGLKAFLLLLKLTITFTIVSIFSPTKWLRFHFYNSLQIKTTPFLSMDLGEFHQPTPAFKPPTIRHGRGFLIKKTVIS